MDRCSAARACRSPVRYLLSALWTWFKSHSSRPSKLAAPSQTLPSLSTLGETLRREVFNESEGEYGENKVEQQRYRCPAIVGHCGGRA